MEGIFITTATGKALEDQISLMDKLTSDWTMRAARGECSGYGPKVTVKRRCSDCKACNSESYAVQGDSGHYVYCEHPSLPERKYIGDTHWDTPDWCPAASPTTQPVSQQEAQEPVAWAFKYDDGTWHDPSTTEHSSGMRPLFEAHQPVAREPLTDEQIDHAIAELGLNYLADAHATNRAVLRKLCHHAHGIK